MEENKRYILDDIFFINDGMHWDPYVINEDKNRIKNLLTSDILETRSGNPAPTEILSGRFSESTLKENFAKFESSKDGFMYDICDVFSYISREDKFASVLLGPTYIKWRVLDNPSMGHWHDDKQRAYLGKKIVGAEYVELITKVFNHVKQREEQKALKKTQKEQAYADKYINIEHEGRDF